MKHKNAVLMIFTEFQSAMRAIRYDETTIIDTAAFQNVSIRYACNKI